MAPTLTKVVAGFYRFGSLVISRDRKVWRVHRGNGVSETYRTFAQALIGAKIVEHVATDADIAAFVRPISYVSIGNPFDRRPL